MVTAHLQEASIILPILAGEDRIHRRLHVVIDAACAGAFEKGEGAVVRVEHHLLRLARIGPEEHHSAVAQAHVSDLHGHRHAVYHDDLVAPVELVGLARRERQRHENRHRLARVLPAPGPRVAANRIVATLVTQCPQLFEQANQGQTFARGLADVYRQHPVEIGLPTPQPRSRLNLSLVGK